MEFGKITNISNVDWTLPPDDPKNQLRLDPTVKSKIYFGAPGWACKYWRGKIYPHEISPEKFLYYYSRQFNCIELNTTHYRIPTPEIAEGWLAEVPSHFKFCPKLYKGISHSPTGMEDKMLLSEWIHFIAKLGDNLGPCFIQFHEQFSYLEKRTLFKFLENWPSEFKLSLELRHNSWFQKNTVLPALTDYLRKRGIGLVITDVAGRRDVLHTSLSSSWSMIRLIGNDLDKSDEQRLIDWSKRLSDWQKRGVQETYLFLHQPDDNWTIEFAQMARKIFLQEGFSDLPGFELVRPRDLFNL